jgi:putative oxidoreductase
MLKRILHPTAISTDWAALIMRLVFCGLIFYVHGNMKLALFSEDPESFSDPVGLGAKPSFYLVVFAEVICAILVCLGLFTRLALLPMIATMIVALLVVHGDNPMNDKELPILYLAVFTAIWLLGPGRFSIDHWIFRVKKA